LAPEKPALQVQDVITIAPSDELEFAGQAFLTAPPGQYEPEVHSAHGPPLGPKYAALQEQFVARLEPPGEVEYVGHPVLAVPPVQ